MVNVKKPMSRVWVLSDSFGQAAVAFPDKPTKEDVEAVFRMQKLDFSKWDSGRVYVSAALSGGVFAKVEYVLAPCPVFDNLNKQQWKIKNL